MIANKEKQEVSLVIERGGEEKKYIMKMTTAASIALEDRLGVTTGDILQNISKFGVKAMRDIFHAMLQKYHGDEFPDTPKGLQAVNALIDDAGGPADIIKLIAQAVSVKKEDQEVATKGPNPPEAQVGTGDASMSSGAVLA